MARKKPRRKHIRIRNIVIEALDEAYPNALTTDQIKSILLETGQRFTGGNNRLAQIIVRTPGIKKAIGQTFRTANVLESSYRVEAFYLADIDRFIEWRDAPPPKGN